MATPGRSLTDRILEVLGDPDVAWSLFLVPATVGLAQALQPVGLPALPAMPRPPDREQVRRLWQAVAQRQAARAAEELVSTARQLPAAGAVPTQALVSEALRSVEPTIGSLADLTAAEDFSGRLQAFTRASDIAQQAAARRAQLAQDANLARLRNLLDILRTGLEAYERQAASGGYWPGTRLRVPQELLGAGERAITGRRLSSAP